MDTGREGGREGDSGAAEREEAVGEAGDATATTAPTPGRWWHSRRWSKLWSNLSMILLYRGSLRFRELILD